MWRGKLIPNRVENYYTSSANSAVQVHIVCWSRKILCVTYESFSKCLHHRRMATFLIASKKRLVFKNIFFLESYKRSIVSSYLYLHKLWTKSIFQCLGPYLNILSRNLRRGLVFSRTVALICGGKRRGSSLQCIQTSVLPSIHAYWFVCQPTDVCIQASKNKSGSTCSIRKT